MKPVTTRVMMSESLWLTAVGAEGGRRGKRRKRRGMKGGWKEREEELEVWDGAQEVRRRSGQVG